MPSSGSRDRSEIHSATLQDVADLAGVSRPTASRVLNGSSRVVRADLTRRVLRAARELRYVSNAPAQALARATTSIVGLIVHVVDDPYFAAIAAGAMRVATEQDLLTMLASTFRDPDREINYVARLRAQRARAVVLAGSGFTDPAYRERLTDELTAFISAGGRVACISQHDLPFDTVLPDNRRGAAQAAALLHALGHRRIGVVSGPPGLTTVEDRFGGFSAKLQSLGVELPDQAIVTSDFSRHGGYIAALELMARDPALTAVFALNDLMAIGVTAALREELDRRVPDDVSVIGFDDIPSASDFTPALTTVNLPLEQMGEQGMRTVLGPPAERPRTIRVRAEVIVRASTGPPPEGSPC